MIEVIFTNGSQSINIKNVKTLQWGSEFSDESLVNQTTRIGQRLRRITVKGFINKSIFSTNVGAQEQLETDLMSVGTGSIQYTGMNDIEDARFLSLEFEEYRGNPVSAFTITFATESDNVHSHTPIKIGDLTLSPANGYDYANVNDIIATQGPDEQLVNNKSRTFNIEGSFIGADLDTINEKQADLVAEVENKTTLVITLSSSSGGFAGLYTVRPGRIEFSSPSLKEHGVSRTFRFECSTFEDYSKEPFTLGEVSQSFAGITIDVVTGIDHNRENDKINTGPLYPIVTEELVVSGKKYFSSWSAYDNFVSLFRPIPPNTYNFTSATGAILELHDIEIGEYQRDGNDLTGAKRYSADVTLTFRWDIGVEGRVFEYNQTHFGVSFYKVENVSFNTSVDQYGNVANKGVSVSGQILSVNLANLKSKVGTKVDYDGEFTDLYVTSVTVNSTQTQNVSGAAIVIYTVSVNAQQLDTSSQAISFIRSLFRMSKAGASGTAYDGETIQFEAVNSINKSISNRYSTADQKFIVTSISLTISGEVWEQDSGGNPANPNKIVDLFNKIDALLNAEKSEQSSANVINAGETLPSNTDIHFMLTNISIGQWTPFTKQENPNAGQRYWKQNVSLTANAVFDLTGSSNSQPDFIESKSFNYTEESPKYTQIQVLNFGTVFKRVGTNPAKEVVTYQKQFRDKQTYIRDDYGDDDTTRVRIPINKSIVTRDVRENRGLVNRHIVEYTANDKIT